MFARGVGLRSGELDGTYTSYPNQLLQGEKGTRSTRTLGDNDARMPAVSLRGAKSRPAVSGSRPGRRYWSYARPVSANIVLGVFVGFTTLILAQFVILRMEVSRRLKFSSAMLAIQTVFCVALAVVAPTARTRFFALALVAAGLVATVRVWRQRKKVLETVSKSRATVPPAR